MVGLIIRHPAYPGIPGIDVLLTPSADELCAYLGLDRDRWARGFDNELEVWGWLTTVREGGMLEVAYKKMVKPRAVRQKGHKKKAGALDGFVGYLRTTRWSEGWDAGMGAGYEVITGQGAGVEGKEVRPETPISQLSSHIAAHTVPALSPSGTATSISSAGPMTPSSSTTYSVNTPTSLATSTSTSTTTSTSTSSSTSEAYHPDHPVPLDERALSAIARWGKQSEYDAELAERRVKAAYLYERQQERVQRRARAEEMRARKEALEEGEMEGLGARLAAI